MAPTANQPGFRAKPSVQGWTKPGRTAPAAAKRGARRHSRPSHRPRRPGLLAPLFAAAGAVLPGASALNRGFPPKIPVRLAVGAAALGLLLLKGAKSAAAHPRWHARALGSVAP